MARYPGRISANGDPHKGSGYDNCREHADENTNRQGNREALDHACSEIPTKYPQYRTDDKCRYVGISN